MALRYREMFSPSRDGAAGENPSDTLAIFVTGDPERDKDDADNPGVVVPFAYSKFPLASQFGQPFSGLTWEQLAPGFWKFTGRYAAGGSIQTGDASFSFSTSGGSQHISYSRKNVGMYVPSYDLHIPPDFGGGINVNGTEVGGADIEIGAFQFKTTFYPPPSVLTDEYMRSLVDLAYHVNSDPVTVVIDGINLQFEPGELRFDYADGSKRRSQNDFEITLNWSALPNRTDVTDIPGFDIPQINGWDLLWVYYTPAPDAAAKVTLQKPSAIYVEQVYLYAPLSPLLIPTSFGQAPGWGTAINGDDFNGGGAGL